MLFGLDGVEIGLIIVFLCLFGGILSGFPVAFAIGGAGVVSFAIIAALDSAGLLVHQAIDTRSDAFDALVASGVRADSISIFRYPDLPRLAQPVFERGWEMALDRNLSFIANRINERVLAGASIETLLAVLMFVMMGITLERSKIANDLLTTMARVFGPLPGGLAVSVVVVGAFLAASTGIVGATVVTMGLLSLPTMLRAGYSPQLATGVIAASGTLGQIIPPSIVIVLLGSLAGDLYSRRRRKTARRRGLFGCADLSGRAGGRVGGHALSGRASAGDPAGAALCSLRLRLRAGEPRQGPRGAACRRRWWRAGDTRRKLHMVSRRAGGADRGGHALSSLGLVGSQDLSVDSFTDRGETASLRTNVGAECRAVDDRAARPIRLGRGRGRAGRRSRRPAGSRKACA